MVTKGFLLGCILQAAQINHVPPSILISVMAIENGKVGMISNNENQSHDLGIMQINDKVWLDVVANSIFNNDKEKAFNHLVYDACFNIKVGAWILSKQIKEARGDVYKGVAYYHSHTPEIGEKYAEKVFSFKKKHFY